ncbi:hypothetical protein [Pseudoflavonifractor phocaeensis]|uniref:hypothetical protein n=1 Tax=Pseudoflavonifractor phocaeensis TaxID=1870988 RepID=UPI0019596610|nr:hypothetical protein [Pseudoflavonifractor phocaeensis]
MCGGCESCPVRVHGCSAPYRGSKCSALRAKAGVDWDPKTNAELPTELLSEPSQAKPSAWLIQAAAKS